MPKLLNELHPSHPTQGHVLPIHAEYRRSNFWRMQPKTHETRQTVNHLRYHRAQQNLQPYPAFSKKVRLNPHLPYRLIKTKVGPTLTWSPPPHRSTSYTLCLRSSMVSSVLPQHGVHSPERKLSLGMLFSPPIPENDVLVCLLFFHIWSLLLASLLLSVVFCWLQSRITLRTGANGADVAAW